MLVIPVDHGLACDPMRMVVNAEIRADHDELVRLVVDGFDGVDDSGVEVRLERCRSSWQSFTGRAYAGPLRRPRPHPDTRFLVRLWVPTVFRSRAYPRTYHYPKRKTAPSITVLDWQERLVALAAHEAFHVHQFREGLRRSEVAAERWAERRLRAWRSARSVAAAVP